MRLIWRNAQRQDKLPAGKLTRLDVLDKGPSLYLAQLLSEAHLQTSRLEGVELQWQRWSTANDKPPLLLLHGGFGSWTHWVANIASLREHRCVWTVDLPGLGSSGDIPKPHTVEHFAELVLDGFSTIIGPHTEFDLAGFSFGALIGAQLAVMAQQRCKHFIVCGAAGFGELHVQVDLLKPPGAETPAEEAEFIHRANLRSLMFARDESVDALAIYVHGDNLSKSRFNSRRLSKGNVFTELIPHIAAKMCGVWGSADATAGGIDAIRARKALFRSAQPGCSFHILQNVGHWAMYEDSAQVNQILIQELTG